VKLHWVSRFAGGYDEPGLGEWISAAKKTILCVPRQTKDHPNRRKPETFIRGSNERAFFWENALICGRPPLSRKYPP
jgi:hypothetical protein